MAEATFLNHPEASRMFIQESAGKPWHWVSCVGVSGLQVSPRSLEYTRCLTDQGIVTSTVPRNAPPAPFDVVFHGNFSKFQSLHRSILGGSSKPNFLFVSAECRDKEKVSDPYYNGNGLIVYGVDISSAYAMFNSQAIDRTANSSGEREDKLSFVSAETAWMRPFQYGLQTIAQNGSTPSSVGPIVSMCVVDTGDAADYVCQACNVPGLKQFLINNGTNYYFTYDGGTTWIQVTGGGIGFAQAFNGTAYMVTATAIKRYTNLDASAWNSTAWTSSTTDVAFAGLANIVSVDPRTFVIGGTNGAVWQSTDAGASWRQSRAALATTSNWYSFKAMSYNSTLKWLVGVGIDAANAVYIQVSTDRGRTWTQVGVALAGKTWAAGSKSRVYSHGAVVYVMVDGDLYVLSCSGINNVMAYTKLSISGASGNITGIGSFSDDKGDQLHITVWDGSAGSIFRTVDGFSSVQKEILPVSIAAGSVAINPITFGANKFGQWLFFGFSQYIYYGRDWESFFDQD